MHPVTRADFDQYIVPTMPRPNGCRCASRQPPQQDQHGCDYLDLAAGIAVTSLGHCRPAMVKALTEQAQQLWHVSNTLTNEPAVAPGTFGGGCRLCRERVFFAIPVPIPARRRSS